MVVGGGPAGLAAAIACRQKGFEVELFDRAQPVIDKACGEGLMPDGLDCLRRLGVDVGPALGQPFCGIRYSEGDVVAEGRFPGLCGLGIRRTRLHQALVQRAEDCDVKLHWGTRVVALRQLDGTVQRSAGVEIELQDGNKVAARWLIGADGLRSKVRQWAAMGRSVVVGPQQARFGVRRHYALEPWSDCVEVYWADGCEAYVTPLAADEIGVAMLWSGGKATFDDLLRRFPKLEVRLRGAARLGRDRGAGPLRQGVERVQLGSVALVGDASGYLDAITGEGLSLAFHQVEALAAALADAEPQRYSVQHRRIARLPNALIRLLLWVEKHPRLRRRMIRALADDAALFNRFLALHTRERPWFRLGWWTGPRLVWRLLRA